MSLSRPTVTVAPAPPSEQEARGSFPHAQRGRDQTRQRRNLRRCRPMIETSGLLGKFVDSQSHAAMAATDIIIALSQISADNSATRLNATASKAAVVSPPAISRAVAVDTCVDCCTVVFDVPKPWVLWLATPASNGPRTARQAMATVTQCICAAAISSTLANDSATLTTNVRRNGQPASGPGWRHPAHGSNAPAAPSAAARKAPPGAWAPAQSN